MKKLLAVLVIMVAVFSIQAVKATSLNLDEFKKIIILEKGRKKPLDTYAKNILLRFSGKSRFNGKPAISWLAQMLFEPKETYDDKIFLINNPEVVEALAIEPDTHRRYSFSELRASMEKLYEYAAAAYDKPDESRTDIEKEFLRIFSNVHTYVQIMDTMQYAFKDDDFKFDNKDYALFDVMQRISFFEKILTNSPKPDKLTDLSKQQQDAFRVVANLYSWIEGYKSYISSLREEQVLTIIPAVTGKKERWFTPWDALLEKQSFILLKELKDVYDTYHKAQQKEFDAATKEFREMVNDHFDDHNIAKPKINLELVYNSLNPFLVAKIFYGFSFIAVLLSTFMYRALLQNTSLIFLLLAFLPHSFAIVSRILILGRPPVTNLFETFIFVAWVCVLLGLTIDRVYKKLDMNDFPLGTLLASISGLVLLLISSKFAADGDTMGVLIAVLDSNFWLSTHVICISIGYAGVAAAGIVGHIFLIQKIIARFKGAESTSEHKQLMRNLYSATLGILGFGLVFSFFGTMLGGIWADQSWGRFWGWDPKENGALLIVLWVAAIFHAKLAGMIKQNGLAICAVIGTAVVMTSWFGINLLGVGLHSYGFTSGLAIKLVAYYIFELLFIFACIFMLRHEN